MEKIVYLKEFVFGKDFNKKRDVPQLTYILIHKRDPRQHTHRTG